MNIKHIVWDWNGTLLDDLWLSIKAINIVLKRHNLPQVNDKKYLNLFIFPVIEYYKKLGFDFEINSFEKVGTEFIYEYTKLQFQPKLHHGVKKLLKEVLSKGITQSLLSAATNEMLESLMNYHNLHKYFTKIKGQNNHYAYGKIEAGKALMKDLKFNPDEVLFVGDTIHDSEVANEIGVHCALISHGHTHHERLKKLNGTVFHSMPEFNAWLNQNIYL